MFALSHRKPKFTRTQKCGKWCRGYWGMHIWLSLCLLAFAIAQRDDLTSIESRSLSLIPHGQPRPWPSAHTFSKQHSRLPAGRVTEFKIVAKAIKKKIRGNLIVVNNNWENLTWINLHFIRVHLYSAYQCVLHSYSASANTMYETPTNHASSTKFYLGIHSSASQNLLMFRDSEYFFSSDRVRKVWHILIQTLSDPVTVFAIEHHVTTRLPRKQCYIWHWIDFTWRYSVSWPCIDFKRASKNSLGQPEVLLISAYQNKEQYPQTEKRKKHWKVGTSANKKFISLLAQLHL